MGEWAKKKTIELKSNPKKCQNCGLGFLTKNKNNPWGRKKGAEDYARRSQGRR